MFHDPVHKIYFLLMLAVGCHRNDLLGSNATLEQIDVREMGSMMDASLYYSPLSPFLRVFADKSLLVSPSLIHYVHFAFIQCFC